MCTSHSYSTYFLLTLKIAIFYPICSKRYGVYIYNLKYCVFLCLDLPTLSKKDEEFNLQPPKFLFFVLVVILNTNPLFLNLLYYILILYSVCLSVSLLELSIGWF